MAPGNSFYSLNEFYSLTWATLYFKINLILFVHMYCHSCLILNFMVEWFLHKMVRIKKYWFNGYLIKLTVHFIWFVLFKRKFVNVNKLFLFLRWRLKKLDNFSYSAYYLILSHQRDNIVVCIIPRGVQCNVVADSLVSTFPWRDAYGHIGFYSLEAGFVPFYTWYLMFRCIFI